MLMGLVEDWNPGHVSEQDFDFEKISPAIAQRLRQAAKQRKSPPPERVYPRDVDDADDDPDDAPDENVLPLDAIPDGITTPRLVRQLLLWYFQSKLIEHFTIVESDQKLIWPRHLGKVIKEGMKLWLELVDELTTHLRH